MKERAARNLRNVIVFALVDGQLSDEEKQFIDLLRTKLGIDEGEFRDLCEQVRQDPKQLSLPRDPVEAEEAIRLLVEAAMADAQAGEREWKLLARLAAKAGLETSSVEQMLAAAGGAHQDEMEALAVEIYAGFAQWDDPTRSAKVAALARFGRESVPPLLRMLESYRVPDGAADGLGLKMLVAEQLGRVGDDRAAYYLAQQVSIGDMDDEITSGAVRCAAAEALGRVVGQEFSRDQDGVVAARAWWFSYGIRQYDRLAM